VTSNHLRAELTRRGIRQIDIAREIGRNPSTVNHIITGRKRSKHVEEAIARRLGKPRERLFPIRRSFRRAA
jgi:transcriptional regulator with XRE-family HTH domain